MVSCSVYGCSNNNNKKLKKKIDKNISFFTFPKDSDLCKVWVLKCARKDKVNPKYARICSEHFKVEDYERNLKNELLNIENGEKKLKKNAYPTLNLYEKSDRQKSSSRTERLCLRQNKTMVQQLLESESADCEIFDVPQNLDVEVSSPVHKTPAVEMETLIEQMKTALQRMTKENAEKEARIQLLSTENVKLTNQLASKNNVQMRLNKIKMN